MIIQNVQTFILAKSGYFILYSSMSWPTNLIVRQPTCNLGGISESFVWTQNKNAFKPISVVMNYLSVNAHDRLCRYTCLWDCDIILNWFRGILNPRKQFIMIWRVNFKMLSQVFSNYVFINCEVIFICHNNN